MKFKKIILGITITLFGIQPIQAVPAQSRILFKLANFCKQYKNPTITLSSIISSVIAATLTHKSWSCILNQIFYKKIENPAYIEFIKIFETNPAALWIPNKKLGTYQLIMHSKTKGEFVKTVMMPKKFIPKNNDLRNILVTVGIIASLATGYYVYEKTSEYLKNKIN